jgi:hypothetical protein
MTIGYNALFSYETTPGGGSYTTVSTVKSIAITGIEWAEVENTPLSQADAAKTYEPGLTEPGELEVELYWNKTIANTLFGFRRVARNWRVSWPDSPATTFTCSGFLKEFSLEGFEIEEELMNNLTVKLSGIPTYTPG